ncbi:MAG: hypothetical protein U0W40_12610 [Acidimicrobiia bacterium]
MYGGRYCEILLVHPGAADGVAGIVADVYNTYSLNDCPEAPWSALDMKAVAAAQQVPVALRNGPRFWLMDRIDKEPLADKVITDFGGVEMIKLATVGLGSAVNPAPYSVHEVDRRTRFTFAKGRRVHELVAPDGTTYVMQTWSQQIDPTLSESDLASLGDRLQLPEGWTYRTRKLKAPLRVVTLDAPAHVLQDELMNSYAQETS